MLQAELATSHIKTESNRANVSVTLELTVLHEANLQ